MNVYRRLAQMGLRIPDPVPAAGSYSPLEVVGDMAYLASHGSLIQGGPRLVGRVPVEVTVEDAREAARVAALNSLATLEASLSLARVRRVVSLTGRVNADPGFDRHPEVIDGASELLNAVFPASRHARSAVGAGSLPLNLTVALELAVEIDPGEPDQPVGALAYDAIGPAGDAALVFLHSLGLDRTVWHSVAERFQGHRRILIDLPGHGESGADPDGFDIDRAAQQVRRVLVAAGATRVVVIGLSIGGIVAQRMRELYPRLVDALVLCGTNHLEPPDELAQVMRGFARRVREEGMDGIGPMLAARWLGDGSDPSPREADRYRRMLVTADPRVMANGFEEVATTRVRQPARLASCPALILVAEGDPPTSHAAAHDLALRFPASTLSVIPGAYHASPAQRPDEVADAIRAFLAARFESRSEGVID